jgi:hypothetical protein
MRAAIVRERLDQHLGWIERTAEAENALKIASKAPADDVDKGDTLPSSVMERRYVDPFP